MTQPTQAPCLVCIGPNEVITDYTTAYLQKALCSHRSAQPDTPCMCAICGGITNHQSALVTWVAPTKEYVLKDLAELFATVRFALEPGAQHFFVIQQAHLLTQACANRLLKILEEPPAGYSFILLTADYQALLPTIQSRCTLLFEAAHDTPQHAGLLAFYTDPAKLSDPQGFDRQLKVSGLTISQTRLLVQQLATSVDYTVFAHPIELRELLDTAQRNLPQPGGGGHFLRWLYLRMHALESGT